MSASPQKMPDSQIIYLNTDVLVLGTGAAGCGAALAAAKEGVDVIMTDKGLLESSGCLGGGNDHFMAVLNTNEPHDTMEDLINFYLKPSSGFTKRMIEQWGEAMPVLVKFMQEQGVNLLHRSDGSLLRSSGLGQPGEWHINIGDGQLIKRIFARHIRGLGVKVVDHVMITRLLKTEEGRVCGAVGYNVLDGQLYVFLAKTVILALGNSCNRATSNSTGNPYNTWHSPFNTGSQFVLAYEAGAHILNMDLKQQATLIPKGFGCAGMNGINGAGAHELNAMGERFMGKYHERKENCPRQYQIWGTVKEEIEGNGPPFVMDMRHINKDDIRHLQYTLMPGDKATFLDYCDQRGVDFATKPMEVELSEIEFSGMIETDDQFHSNVPGLYNGCVFYTFSGSMCSGYAAGGWAAKEAKELTPVSSFDEHKDVIAKERKKIFAPFSRQKANSVSNKEFENAVRQVMSYYIGYIRNEAGMNVALERMEFLSTLQEQIHADSMHGLMQAHEAMHLLKSSRLSTLATRERRESGRSLYRRSDYPELNPDLDKVLLIREEQGKPTLQWL